MKTNEWIEEQVPVQKTAFDDKGNKTSVTEWHTQKVMYVDVKPRKVICADGQHVWFSKDIHKYQFGCKHCTRTVIAYPVSYEFKDGVLTHRDTGQTV